MFRRLAVAAVATAALSIALTGCGKSNSGSGTGSSGSGSGSSGGDATAWAEKVCQAVEGDITALGKTPDVDMSDPQKTKDGMVDYLGKFSTTLDHMAGAIKGAGDPPVSGAKGDVDKLVSELQTAKQTVDTAKDNLAKTDVSDPASFQAAFAKIGEDMGSLSNLDDPTKNLESNQQLKDAFDKAPTCKKLDSGGSSSTPTS
jgi:hypothetical protein